MQKYLSFYDPLLDIFSDLRDEVYVTEISEKEIRNSRLTDAIDLSWSTQFEIDLREFESIIRFLHGFESLTLVLLGREEIAITLMLSSPDSSTELMDL